MGQSGQTLRDRPEHIQPQGDHGQAAECGHHLHDVGLAVAVRFHPEPGVMG